jgi:uncharacterized protein YaeQ
MALGSTIYKANINLSNFNTNYYKDFNLTLAKHPSENESRLMFRLLAFLHSAHEDLEFTRGLSNTEEPELWQKNYSGEILLWVELGTPELKRIRQACGKSHLVKIYTYQVGKSKEWYEKIKGQLLQNDKVEIYHFEVLENGPLESLVNSSMRLSCIIEEDQIYLGDDERRVTISVTRAS